jgi:hypothetical protein
MDQTIGKEDAVDVAVAEEVAAAGDMAEADVMPEDPIIKMPVAGFLMKIGNLCQNMRRRKSVMSEANMQQNKRLVN